MADDHSQRPYRSSETIARSGQARSPSPASGSDPLAELARLIGQTDPFGDMGKEPPRRAAAQPEPAMDWAAAQPQAYAPQQPAPPVAPDFPPQSHYAQAPSADLYQVEQDVPAYMTQQRQPAYDAPRGYHQQGEAHEDAYDDLPPPRRRLGVMAIAGIFALAVVGTAGAFGYRAVFGGTGTRVPPPVIKADTAPSKIVPDSAGKDSSKLITERVGVSGEKIVSREEKPVDIKDKIATPVFPPVTATAGQGAQAGSAMASPGNGVVGGEPKKVHTLTIRPDQPMVADATSSAPMPRPGSPLAMPEPQQQASRAAAPALAPARPQQQAAAEPAPAPRAAAPARSANAPLSLNPDAAPAPAPRAPARTANAAPTSLAAVPSANPASAARGGYAVQVTSQRSEAEAQTAYHALQGKYGSVLGSHSMFVHKVELGAKGTYYRAMVGPFGSQAEASQLCTSLKSAGGSCLVQRN